MIKINVLLLVFKKVNIKLNESFKDDKIFLLDKGFRYLVAKWIR